MCACVSLQVERVVESFTAKRAQVALVVAVTLDVTVQEALERKDFVAGSTHELVVRRLHSWRT